MSGAENLGAVKLLRIPDRANSLAELLGTVARMEGVENVVVIVNDADGVVSMTVDGTTAERMNWMLDRAKLRLHE